MFLCFLGIILVPELFRKLRETPGMHSHLVSPKSEPGCPSYDQTTKKNRFLFSSSFASGVCFPTFLTSDSDSACRNPPRAHLQTPGNLHWTLKCPLEGYRADPGKILSPFPSLKSGDHVPPYDLILNFDFSFFSSFSDRF